jgi:hypothetical protein
VKEMSAGECDGSGLGELEPGSGFAIQCEQGVNESEKQGCQFFLVHDTSTRKNEHK